MTGLTILITSTDKTLFLNGALARVWEGRTEHGLPVVCLVSELTGSFDGPFDEFERYTVNHSPASPTAQAFAVRMAPKLRVIK